MTINYSPSPFLTFKYLLLSFYFVVTLCLIILSQSTTFSQYNGILLITVLTLGISIGIVNLLLKRSIPTHLLQGILVFSFLILLFSISTSKATSFQNQAIENTIQLIAASLFFMSMSTIRWDKVLLSIFCYISLVFFVVNIVLWIGLGFPTPFQGLIAHSNGLGSLTYILLYFPLITITFSSPLSLRHSLGNTAFFLGVMLLVASNSRSSWLAFIIVIFTFYFGKFIFRKRILYFSLPILLVCLSITFTIFYANVRDTSWYMDANELTLKYTGKQFVSGRELFWKDLLTAIAEKPISGYGAGIEARHFIAYDFSSHNLYLQIILQVGIFGLIFLYVILFWLCICFWQGKDDRGVDLSYAYLLSVIIHQIFEVSLIQNNLMTFFLIWLVFAIGVQRATRQQSQHGVLS